MGSFSQIVQVSASGEVHSELLAQLDWIQHGFGTRLSELPENLATAKQIHSGTVLEACRAGIGGDGDALFSDRPGLAIGVRTADCVPILLADTEHHVVAAVHAGWRGTEKEIVRLTLERMREKYGTKPLSTVAAIGPAIGACCFEVGPEVARQFSKWESRLADTTRKEHLDLPDLNRRQLVSAGVPEWNIDVLNLCTACRTDLLYSFRKEREAAGRQTSWIRVDDDPC